MLDNGSTRASIHEAPFAGGRCAQNAAKKGRHVHSTAFIARLLAWRGRDDNPLMSFSAATGLPMTPSPPDSPTSSQPPPPSASRTLDDPWLREIVSRVPLIVLHLWLLGRVMREWLLTGRITGFLLLANATLIIYLTLRRRQADRVDRNLLAWTAALGGTLGPLALTPSGQGPIPDAYTAWLTLVGFGVSTAGLVALGRSFGIVAAHRGIVQHGIYRIIRHPAYAGYFLTHIGFVLAYPTMWNFAVWLIADSLQLVRIMFEERILGQNDEYRTYMTRVRWRMLPGIF